MKLNEIPVNAIVELQFVYFGDKQKVSSGLLYKYSETVYVSAIKDMGEIIPVKKLKDTHLIYKTEAGIYTFENLILRSVSFSSQHLYAIQSEQEAEFESRKDVYKLFVGVPISAKIITENAAKYMNCMMKDISITGMGILSLDKLDNTSKIEIRFRVNEDIIETLTGNIIDSYELKNGKGFLYECEFDGPNETIGKYITKQQERMNLFETE